MPKCKPGRSRKEIREPSLSADEGDPSSAPVTSPWMALPSQAVWLGSDDTSGQDEDELPDSELADFIVGSEEEEEDQLGNGSDENKEDLDDLALTQSDSGATARNDSDDMRSTAQ